MKIETPFELDWLEILRRRIADCIGGTGRIHRIFHIYRLHARGMWVRLHALECHWGFGLPGLPIGAVQSDGDDLSVGPVFLEALRCFSSGMALRQMRLL